MRFSASIAGTAIGFAMGLAFIPAAAATPVTHQFTVTATSGPLNGTVAAGSFTYDSSSILPGLTNVATGLLTALDFTWNGIAYNETTANTGSLFFNANGDLLLMLFGTHCTAGSCQTPAGVNWWNIAGANGFNYALPTAGSGVGIVNLTQTPEPSSMALALLGLSGLVLAKWRRR